MAITFALVILTMTIITVFNPLPKPKKMPVQKDFDMRPAPSIIWLGSAVLAAVFGFYIIFC